MRGFRRRALRFLFLALVFWVIWAPLSSVWGRAASEDEWLEASQWEERRFPSLDARVEALGGSLPEDELWYSISGSEGRTFLRGRWSDGPLLGPGAWGAFVLCFGRAGAGQGGVEVLWRRWNTPQAARRVRLGYAGRPLEFLRLGGGLRHETQWLAGRRYSGWAAEGFGWVRAFGDDVSRLAVFAGVERFGLQLRSAPNRVFPSDRTPPLVELGLEGQWRGRLRLVSAWSYVPDRSLSPLERWFWAGGVEWAPREWAQLRAGYRAPVAREQFGKGVLSWGLGSRIGPATVSYALLVDQDPSAEELFRHLLSVEVVAPLGPGPDDEGLIPSQGGFVLPDAQGRFVRPDLEVISPNGDGVQDRVRLRGVNLPPGARLILWDRRGAPVWEFTPKERNVDMEWRGLNADGEPFPDGRYFWRLLDGAGREYAHGVLAVDTRPPALRVQLDPPLLTPARGEQPPVRIDLRAEDDNRVVEWSLAILQGGRTIVADGGGAPVPSTRYWQRWERRVRAGEVYTIRFGAKDEAGNAISVERRLPVLDPRPFTRTDHPTRWEATIPPGAFRISTAAMHADLVQFLDRVASVLLAAPELAAYLYSTDLETSKLTESRLEAVRNDLMARGVELERVTIIRRPEDAASGSPGTLRLVLAERDHPRLQPRTETTGVQYRLLLGSFQDNRSAEELARRLQEVGFRPVLETITLEGKIWHRVLLEGFQERRDAELMRDLVRPYLDQAPLILRTPHP